MPAKNFRSLSNMCIWAWGLSWQHFYVSTFSLFLVFPLIMMLYLKANSKAMFGWVVCQRWLAGWSQGKDKLQESGIYIWKPYWGKMLLFLTKKLTQERWLGECPVTLCSYKMPWEKRCVQVLTPYMFFFFLKKKNTKVSLLTFLFMIW